MTAEPNSSQVAATGLTEQVDRILADAFARAGLATETARSSRASRPDLADLQCNGVMPLAKAARRSPRDLAQAVVGQLAGHAAFTEVHVAGPGFINLRLSPGILSQAAADQLANPHLSVGQVPQPAPAILDFGGPNVAKPLHVGHLRSLVIGESIRRILLAQGMAVLSDIHLGDWGLQMGMLISEIRIRWPALPCFDAEAPTLPEGALPLTMADLQRLYPEAAAACKADPARLEQARQATAELQAGHPGYAMLWRALRKVSLDAQLRDVRQLGAHFDLLLGESDVQPLIPGMVDALRAGGVAVESEGALVIQVATDADAKPMPPLLLEKSDGAALYATTDLATLLDRQERFHPSRVLYVVDQRQSLHFEQVFRAARRAGYAEGTELVHIGFGTVNGPDGKPYKTREGGVAQLSDLLDEAVGKARERIRTDEAELGTAEREELARTVGLAAVKFADLSSHRLSGYVFDADRLVSFEGRTGPYVQYACVRIASILAKGQERGQVPGAIRVKAASERSLVMECARLPDCVASATAGFAPNEIADYVFGLAQAFSRFYTECPVLGAATEAEQASRLALCDLAHRVLAKGLWLLGIEVPARM